MKMSEREWRSIARFLLPDAERVQEEIEEAIRLYQQDNGVITAATRTAVEAAKQGAVKLRSRLRSLQNDRDFRTYGVEDSTFTSLDPHLRAVDDVILALESSQTRIANAPRQNAQRRRLQALFVELLEIRSYHLGVDAPNQSAVTSSSGDFRGFLKSCLRVAEPSADERTRTEWLEVGISLAIESFAAMRADPIYSWKWDELFPETDTRLKQSRRFKRVLE